MNSPRKLIIATRGSALALAQAHLVRQKISQLRPGQPVEIKIFRTTGDALQAQAPSAAGAALPRGLFTKELEHALLESEADLAVHSLKDLPTALPEGLALGAALEREDPRDILLYRDAAYLKAAIDPLAEWSPGQKERRGFDPGLNLDRLPDGAVIATNSKRRAEQVLARRPSLKILPIRGNVPTRLTKLMERPDFDALLLAVAGLHRLLWEVAPCGKLRTNPRLSEKTRQSVAAPPEGILGTLLELESVVPAVGQGAIGIEIRKGDAELIELCAGLNHTNTWRATLAERTFLAAMGGGCESSTAGHGRVVGHLLHFTGIAFAKGRPYTVSIRLPAVDPVRVGSRAASQLLKAMDPPASNAALPHP